MSRISFDNFFRTAMGADRSPYDYQCRLACGEPNGRAEAELCADLQARVNAALAFWLSADVVCPNEILSIPTVILWPELCI
jgi:hypothetical protein